MSFDRFWNTSKQLADRIVLWIFSRSNDLKTVVRGNEDHLDVVDTIDGEDGQKMFPYPVNIFETPTIGYERNWISRACEIFADVSEGTIAFQAALLALATHPWRIGKGIVTLQSVVATARYFKYRQAVTRMLNYANIDSSVRDRVATRSIFTIEEGLGTYNCKIGAPFAHSVGRNMLFILRDFTDRAYQTFVSIMLGKLEFIKKTNPEFSDVFHICILDDSLFLIQDHKSNEIKVLPQMVTLIRKLRTLPIFITQHVEEIVPIILKDVGTYLSYNQKAGDAKLMGYTMGISDPQRLSELQSREFAILRDHALNKVVWGTVPQQEETTAWVDPDLEKIIQSKVRQQYMGYKDIIVYETIDHTQPSHKKNEQLDEDPSGDATQNNQDQQQTKPVPQLPVLGEDELKTLEAFKDCMRTQANVQGVTKLPRGRVKNLTEELVRKGYLSTSEGGFPLRIKTGKGPAPQRYAFTQKAIEVVGSQDTGKGGVAHKIILETCKGRLCHLFPSEWVVEEYHIGGKKTVDVALVNGNEKLVSVEIGGPKTKPGHEALDNVLKCHEAGFGCVVSVAATKPLQQKIERACDGLLTTEQRNRTLFVTCYYFATIKKGILV